MVTQGVEGSRVWLCDSLSDAGSAPREVAKIAAQPDLMLSNADGILIPGNIPGISRETEIYRLDKATFGVTQHKHNFWVKEWQRLPGGVLRMTRQNGLSMYRSESDDGGKTWTHEQAALPANNYWMDPSSAYSLDYSAGFSAVSNFLKKTTDGGTRWEKLGKPLETPDFAGSIVYADPTEVLVQGLSVLYSTRDEGKTWVQVFPPVR